MTLSFVLFFQESFASFLLSERDTEVTYSDQVRRLSSPSSPVSVWSVKLNQGRLVLCFVLSSSCFRIVACLLILIQKLMHLECTCILSLEWSSGRFILWGLLALNCLCQGCTLLVVSLTWLEELLSKSSYEIHESSDSIRFSWEAVPFGSLSSYFHLLLEMYSYSCLGSLLSPEKVYGILFVIVSLSLSFVSWKSLPPSFLGGRRFSDASVGFLVWWCFILFLSERESLSFGSLFSSLMSWTQWMACVSIT